MFGFLVRDSQFSTDSRSHCTVLVSIFTSCLQGAAIIRMLGDVLGRDVFFQGLQHYLQTYSFGNANTEDLWQCLTQEAKKRKVHL